MNSTQSDLELVAVDSSCGCVVAKSSLGLVPNRQRLEIELQLKPDASEMNQQLLLSFRGLNQKVSIAVQGRTAERFSVSPEMLQIKRSQTEYEVEIAASFADSLDGARCTLESDSFSLVGSRVEDGKMKVAVRAKNDLASSFNRGGFERRVNLLLYLSNGDRKPAFFEVSSAEAASIIPKEISTDQQKRELIVFRRGVSQITDTIRVSHKGKLISEGKIVRKSKSLAAYELSECKGIVESLVADVEEWTGSEWVQIGSVRVRHED